MRGESRNGSEDKNAPSPPYESRESAAKDWRCTTTLELVFIRMDEERQEKDENPDIDDTLSRNGEEKGTGIDYFGVSGVVGPFKMRFVGKEGHFLDRDRGSREETIKGQNEAFNLRLYETKRLDSVNVSQRGRTGGLRSFVSLLEGRKKSPYNLGLGGGEQQKGKKLEAPLRVYRVIKRTATGKTKEDTSLRAENFQTPRPPSDRAVLRKEL